MILPHNQLNPLAQPFIPLSNEHSFDTQEPSLTENVSSNEDHDDPAKTLKQLKSKNTERPIIGHININSIYCAYDGAWALLKFLRFLLLFYISG